MAEIGIFVLLYICEAHFPLNKPKNLKHW